MSEQGKQSARDQIKRLGDHGRRGVGAPLGSYANDVFVVCPACGSRATVMSNSPFGIPFAPSCSRLECPSCGLLREIAFECSGDAGEFTFTGGAVDPAFELPLWLQADCCGHVLWAYNPKHVEAIERYIAASDRSRYHGTWSMETNLPDWMKSAHNRERVTRGLERLQERAKAG